MNVSTELSLDISRTSSLKTLVITDTSSLTEDVENYLLEILPPSSNWITYKVSPNFTNSYNASSLNIQKVKDKAKLADLYDGIYELKLSYKPNYSTYVHYLHLRTSYLEYDFGKVMNTLYSEQCSLIRQEFMDKKRLLLSIWMDIKAAIYKVEIEHDKVKGIALYNKAKEDLKQFKDDCGC